MKLLSRLSHRHIVRYYTTWLETPDGTVSESSSGHDGSSGPGSEETSRQLELNNGIFTFNLDDLTTRSQNRSASFPSIHFSRESSGHLSSMDDQESGSEDDSDSASPILSRSTQQKLPIASHRMLYIQMVTPYTLFRPSMTQTVSIGICRKTNVDRGMLCNCGVCVVTLQSF